MECTGFSPPDLSGDTRFLLRVSWDEQTAFAGARAWLTEQPHAIVERAAVALAALTFAHLIPNGELRVSDEGDRADFRLPRLRRALEISGTQHRRELPRRRREKTAQMLANPWGWDGYVFICCFDSGHRLIHWSYHTQREAEK